MSISARTTPNLRFPEFSGEWKVKPFDNVFEFHKTNSLSRAELTDSGDIVNIHYGDIHMRLGTHFDVKRDAASYLKTINSSELCKVGDLVIADASEDRVDIGKSVEVINVGNAKVVAGLHTFLARPAGVALGYSGYLMQSNHVRKQLWRIATGASVLGISKTELGKVQIVLSEVSEQHKIASFLTAVDDRIAGMAKKVELLKKYKKGVMHKIFAQEIRFRDESGKEYPEWEEKRLDELLDYEQPTNYIVSDTEYDDDYKTPVLTAGKSFVLGYTNETDGIFKANLPVIIFDDFTTTSQFVNFPFKVKSSALKILKAKPSVDIGFTFAAMQQIKYKIGGHGRHWISKYSKLKVMKPSSKEQQKISDLLTAIDDKIALEERKLAEAKRFKKFLLQQMFV